MRSIPCFACFSICAAVPLALASVATSATTTAAVSAAAPAAVDLDARLARPLLLAGQKNSAQLRVSLIGREAQAGQSQNRPEVNVCIAIDRSGSMAGEKMENARRGALSAVAKLRDGDIVSVVAYDDVVRVVVPAARAVNRTALQAGINALQPGGDTALFAGVVKCATEVRKFASKNRVNRIVLLSDGMANVGPSSPAELGTLGSELAAEGISVATVGLGADYNEDLMAELAVRSDGGHVFVERPADLARFLEQELGAIAAVVARDVEVKIACTAGARPLRVIGRPAQIVGQIVTTSFGKIYGRRQHLFVIELETDAGVAGSSRPLATVEVAYHDLLAHHDSQLRQPIVAQFTARGAEVDKRADPAILSELSILNADLVAERAMKLRDQGDFAAAQQELRQNADQLARDHQQYRDPRLQSKVREAKQQAESLSPKSSEWNIQRKQMKKSISDAPLMGFDL
jgi:Ca-activated chloride channel homolog